MIDLNNAWSIVHANAETALQRKDIYATPRSPTQYQILSVSSNKITILAAGENKSFGPAALHSQLSLLNEAGGRLHYRKFFQNVARGTTVVYLHPDLDWGPAGEEVIVINRKK